MTVVMAKGGGAEIGATKRGKSVKIMAIVYRHGLPLSVSTHAANHHEVRLVRLCLDFYMIDAFDRQDGTLTYASSTMQDGVATTIVGSGQCAISSTPIR